MAAAAVLAGIAAIPAPGGSALAQTITRLGYLLPEHGNSQAKGVSADGSVVAGVSSVGGMFDHSFRWTSAGGMQDIGPGIPVVTANGISADGAVIVGECDLGDGAGRGAFRWAQAGGVQRLSLPAGWGESVAHGASADGSVVSGYARGPDTHFHALRWTNAGVGGGTFQDLGLITSGCGVGTAYHMGGISADGSVVVGFGSARDGPDCQFHAFRWTSNGSGGGTMQDLGRLPVTTRPESRAYNCSVDGAVVVGRAYTNDYAYQACRWSAAGIQDIGPQPRGPYDLSIALATNGNGSAVVGSTNPEDSIAERALLWTSALGTVDFTTYTAFLGVDLGDMILQAGVGMTPDGQTIVGYGRHTSTGCYEAWIIDLHQRCGSADFNCDGDVGTDADIEAFFACIAGTCPTAPCTSNADFNGDGDTGTDADIEAFFRVLGGGMC
jgi:probable HAF family extracellular repeat protein